MIRLTTKDNNVLYLPKLEADEATAIQAQCSHGVSLFSDCRDCELEMIRAEVREMIRRAYAQHSS